MRCPTVWLLGTSNRRRINGRIYRSLNLTSKSFITVATVNTCLQHHTDNDFTIIRVILFLFPFGAELENLFPNHHDPSSFLKLCFLSSLPIFFLTNLFLLSVSILRSFPCAASIFLFNIHASTYFHKHTSAHVTLTLMTYKIHSVRSSDMCNTYFLIIVSTLSTLSHTNPAVHYCTPSPQNIVCRVRHALTRQPASLVLRSCTL